MALSLAGSRELFHLPEGAEDGEGISDWNAAGVSSDDGDESAVSAMRGATMLLLHANGNPVTWNSIVYGLASGLMHGSG